MDELINVKVASTDSDLDVLAFFYLDVHTSGAKAVNAFGFTDEKHFQVFLLRVLVQVVTQLLVNIVVCFGVIDLVPGLFDLASSFLLCSGGSQLVLFDLSCDTIEFIDSVLKPLLVLPELL